jgi:hypothetical protein
MYHLFCGKRLRFQAALLFYNPANWRQESKLFAYI